MDKVKELLSGLDKVAAVQVLGVLAVVAGIAAWSWPAALIIGGLAAAIVPEVRDYLAGTPQPAPSEPVKIPARGVIR